MSILVKMPESWLCAERAEWKNPASQEWMILANLYDLLAIVNSKKRPKPFPRPWRNPDTKKIGGKGKSRAEVIRRLEAMNKRKSEE